MRQPALPPWHLPGSRMQRLACASTTSPTGLCPRAAPCAQHPDPAGLKLVRHSCVTFYEHMLCHAVLLGLSCNPGRQPSTTKVSPLACICSRRSRSKCMCGVGFVPSVGRRWLLWLEWASWLSVVNVHASEHSSGWFLNVQLFTSRLHDKRHKSSLTSGNRVEMGRHVQPGPTHSRRRQRPVKAIVDCCGEVSQRSWEWDRLRRGAQLDQVDDTLDNTAPVDLRSHITRVQP